MATNEVLMRFQIILHDGNGTLYKTHSARQRKIARILWGKEWQRADLRVAYYVNGELMGENAGSYTCKADAAVAWEAFTDPELLAA